MAHQRTEWRVAWLVDTRTMKPLAPTWTPRLQPWEIREANRRLTEAGLPRRWEETPWSSSVTADSTADVGAASTQETTDFDLVSGASDS